jgi:hypothetical protein
MSKAAETLKLTDKERWARREQVVSRRAAGVPASQIATELEVSVNTIYNDVEWWYAHQAERFSISSFKASQAQKYERLWTQAWAMFASQPSDSPLRLQYFDRALEVLREYDHVMVPLPPSVNIGTGAGGTVFQGQVNGESGTLSQLESFFRGNAEARRALVEGLRGIRGVVEGSVEAEWSAPGGVLPGPDGANVSRGVARPDEPAPEPDPIRPGGARKIDEPDGSGGAP